MSLSSKPPCSIVSHHNRIQSVSSDPEVEAEKIKVLNETRAFVKDRDALVNLIDQSDELIVKLLDFAQNHWSLVHPQLNEQYNTHFNQQALIRSQSSPVDQNSTSQTHAPSAQSKSTMGLSILCLDNLSVARRRTLDGSKDIESSLMTQSLASSMLCSRFQYVQSHLADLRIRVLDRNSRILVTGDLNAGKSTFVNALLGCQVAPTDQQPCTEVMCEILDKAEIHPPIEQIHAIPHGSVYDIENRSTYQVFPIDQLSELVNINNDDIFDGEDRSSPYQLLKVYITGPERPKAQSDNDGLNATSAISLLRQGDVSVSFIDSPGLNRDTLSTMELFSQQSTIDVVVFVVSAENQFTLSAQEFLWAASQEKAYVFVVVNKWGGIRDKVKAERRIREQLRKLSPATWQERTELVHFVDSQEAVLNLQIKGAEGKEPSVEIEPFDHLQRSLSSFVFHRRSISKLQPAQTYTRNLLQDLSIITSTNLKAAKNKCEEARANLEQILPRFNHLSANSHVIDETISQIEEDTVSVVYKNSRRILASALKNIRDGRLAQSTVMDPNSPEPYFPVYDGLLSVFQYAEDVRKVLINSLEDSVKLAENVARNSTSSAIEAIRDSSVKKNLLDEDQSDVRKFNPQAMFSKPRKYQLVMNPNNLGSFGHCASALGLATFSDLIDFDRLNLFKSYSSSKSIETYLNNSNSGTASLVGSLGFGTLTLFGTGVTGGRVVVDAIVKVSEIAGNKSFRKWTGTVVAIMSVGFGIYLMMDIPRAIPRSIGKKIERELNLMVSNSYNINTHLDSKKAKQEEISREARWIDHETERMTKETRKVVRLTGFESREKFRSCFESISSQTSQYKTDVNHSQEVIEWLNEFETDLNLLSERCLAIGRCSHDADPSMVFPGV